MAWTVCPAVLLEVLRRVLISLAGDPILAGVVLLEQCCIVVMKVAILGITWE